MTLDETVVDELGINLHVVFTLTSEPMDLIMCSVTILDHILGCTGPSTVFVFPCIESTKCNLGI